MGTHWRLGAGAAGAGAEGTEALREWGDGVMLLAGETGLVKMVVEGCRGWPEGVAGKAEGVVRMVGGGRGVTSGGGYRARGTGGRVSGK